MAKDQLSLIDFNIMFKTLKTPKIAQTAAMKHFLRTHPGLKIVKETKNFNMVQNVLNDKFMMERFFQIRIPLRAIFKREN